MNHLEWTDFREKALKAYDSLPFAPIDRADLKAIYADVPETPHCYFYVNDYLSQQVSNAGEEIAPLIKFHLIFKFRDEFGNSQGGNKHYCGIVWNAEDEPEPTFFIEKESLNKAGQVEARVRLQCRYTCEQIGKDLWLHSGAALCLEKPMGHVRFGLVFASLFIGLMAALAVENLVGILNWLNLLIGGAVALGVYKAINWLSVSRSSPNDVANIDLSNIPPEKAKLFPKNERLDSWIQGNMDSFSSATMKAIDDTKLDRAYIENLAGMRPSPDS